MSRHPAPPATNPMTLNVRTARLPIVLLAVAGIVTVAGVPATGAGRLMILGAAPVRLVAGLLAGALSSWQVGVSAVVHVGTVVVTAVGSLSYAVSIPLLLGTTALAVARRPESP